MGENMNQNREHAVLKKMEASKKAVVMLSVSFKNTENSRKKSNPIKSLKK